MFRNKKIFFFLIIVFCAIRFIHLDADPSILKTTNDIHDEAWWAQNAKNKVLENTWLFGEYSGGIAISPLSNFIIYCFFKIFGINFFALRLIPVLASIGIILLFYFYLKRYDEQIAIISTLLLAVNHSFFMYCRIGHLETLELFFIVAMFFFLSLKKKIFYILAGLCWSAAILSKISILSFLLVLIIYLAIQLYRKHLEFRDLLLFVFSSVLPLAFYYFVFFLPHADSFTMEFNRLHKAINATYAFNLHTLILKFVFFPASEYFIEPSIALLLILSLAYLLKTDLWKNIFSSHKNISEPELLAVVWFLASIVSLLITDFVARRFTLLIIPFCILAGSFLNRSYFQRNDWHSSYLKIMISFFLLFPLLGLHLNFHLKEHLPAEWLNGKTIEDRNDELIDYLVLLYCLFFILFLSVKKIREKVQGRILGISILAFVTMLVINAEVYLKNLYLLPGNRIFLSALVLAMIILSGLILFTQIVTGKKIFKLLYFSICLIFTGNDLIHPLYSISNSAGYIKNELQLTGTMIGQPLMMELTLPSRVKMLHYTVDDLADNTIIKRQSALRPDYYGTRSGKNLELYFLKEKNFVEENLNANLKLIEIFPWYPLNGIVRDSLFIYHIEYRN